MSDLQRVFLVFAGSAGDCCLEGVHASMDGARRKMMDLVEGHDIDPHDVVDWSGEDELELEEPSGDWALTCSIEEVEQ